MSAKREVAFLLKRAEEEVILAVQADQTPAGDVHRELAVRYSALAREALAKQDEDAA